MKHSISGLGAFVAFVVKSAVISSTPGPLSTAMPPLGGKSGASPASMGGASDSPAFSPLYQQIKTLILQSLQTGEWKSGEMIPSGMELATHYKVSQGTVRKAIDELAAGDLIARRQGKGTFATTHYEERVQFRFLRLMPEQGKQHYPSNHVLECKRIRVPAEIAHLLELKAGDSIVQIRRILFFSGELTMLEEIWLPGASFKRLMTERLTEWRGPMYAFFKAEFDVHILRTTGRVRAAAVDPTMTELLSVVAESPLLPVEYVSHAFDNKPVEICRDLYATTRHYYQGELNQRRVTGLRFMQATAASTTF